MTSRDQLNRPNRLQHETSEYLRQHRTNPVDWYPWSEEALEAARSEDKPLLISIGYSACHWCHVMERESFEDEEIARIMNAGFINIKVDREERPDIDQLYMDVATRVLGRGGWPLTVFCTPNGRPFYCGTYFPPMRNGPLPSFREVLDAMESAYRDRRDDVESQAAQLLELLTERGTAPGESAAAPALHAAGPGARTVVEAAAKIMELADVENGGFGGATKFPMPTNLELLLTALDFVPPDAARPIFEHCARTCQAMARRGLWDHLGGGFHRYSVDRHWDIPHFEKMLYDQGLLLRVYAEVYRRSEFNPEFEWPLRECATFIFREMTGPEGAFFASQDADSEGEEGRFYVWTPAQVAEVLADDSAEFCHAYGVTNAGNFEAGSTQLAERVVMERADFEEQRRALFRARQTRVAPATDPKRIAAWNGHVISGLARAGSLLEDEAMLEGAAIAADFILSEMRTSDGRLLRIFDDGGARILAFLDDHAALTEAALDLYRAGLGERFATASLELARQIADRFYDEEARDLFLTARDAEPLVHRPRSDADGATPQASGLAVSSMLRVAELSGDVALREVATTVITTQAPRLEKFPHAFPTLARAVALTLRRPATVVIVGPEDASAVDDLARTARREFLFEDSVIVHHPGAPVPPCVDESWLAGRGVQDGQPAAFVCRGTTCSLPVTRPPELAALAGR